MPALRGRHIAETPLPRAKGKQQGRTDKRCSNERPPLLMANARMSILSATPSIQQRVRTTARGSGALRTTRNLRSLSLRMGRTCISHPAPPRGGLALVRDPRCPGSDVPWVSRHTKPVIVHLRLDHPAVKMNRSLHARRVATRLSDLRSVLTSPAAYRTSYY